MTVEFYSQSCRVGLMQAVSRFIAVCFIVLHRYSFLQLKVVATLGEIVFWCHFFFLTAFAHLWSFCNCLVIFAVFQTFIIIFVMLISARRLQLHKSSVDG